MRIYISGPMTGHADHNFPAFDAAAERLRAEGHFVINPAELAAHFGTAEKVKESFENLYFVEDQLNHNRLYEPSKDMMRWTSLARALMSADLAAVRSCEAIYLLKGWVTSRGAKKELREALEHGLLVMQEGAEP